MQIFKSRYIVIIKHNGNIEIRHKSKYIQVFSLILILTSLSIGSMWVGEWGGAVFLLIFVSFLFFGLVRSSLRYPIVFTNSQLIYKKGFSNVEIDYTVLKKVSLQSITEKKWKLEISDKSKNILTIYLFTDNQVQKNGIIAFKKSLREMGVPLK